MKKFLFILLVILVIGGVAFAGKGNMSSNERGQGYGRSVNTEDQQNQFGKGRGNGFQNQDQTCEEFVDEDGDGVCDNCDGEGLAPQDGTGNQYGRNGANRFDRSNNEGNSRNSSRGVSGKGNSVNNSQETTTGVNPQDGTGNQYGRNGK